MSGSSINVVNLSGELDISRRNEIGAVLRVNGTETGILLDCHAVTYADSTALAELLRFRNEAEAADIPVAILVGSKQFARIIQYAGLGELFRLFDDRASALTYLSNAGNAR
ncbi:MAG: STAS domain-containing protein [Candidatus Eremiobacteraeota bacterium]|nr:STAS domain-containing protein [Candidatus Eremiobacteraeota bacterium]